MERTYKFRLYPKGRQVATMDRWLSLLHTLYNAGLEQRIMVYREYHKSQTYNKQAMELPELKHQLPEYGEIYSQILQDVLKRLDKAYNNFSLRMQRGDKPGIPTIQVLQEIQVFHVSSERFQDYG